MSFFNSINKSFRILLLATLFISTTAWGGGLFDKELLKTLKQSAEEKITGQSATPVEEEVAIGRQIAGNLLGAAPLVRDAKLQKYVNNVGRWVADQSERADLAWHFEIGRAHV